MIVRHILPGAGLLPNDLDSDAMSGLVGAAYNLARQQALRGWNVELFGLARPGSSARSYRTPDGLILRPVHPWRWCQVGNYDFRYHAPVAVRLTLTNTGDIHHVYANPYLLAFGRARKRILHYEMAIPEVPAAYIRAAQGADAVICCSRFIRDQFLKRVDYLSERVYVVYNGVDLKKFAPGDKTDARLALGIPSEELVVLYAGAVHEDKGLIYLVRALHMLRDRSQVRLVVAGSARLWGNAASHHPSWHHLVTPYERSVTEEARELTTTFLGNVPQARMPAVFQAADIVVCPSVCEEGLALINLEAMASSLPVIGSNVGSIPEVVTDGVTGFLVPPGDPEALANRLELLMTQPELRAEMGRNALRVVQRFDWSIIAEQIEGIYSTLLINLD
ncbi:MAG: glycosyltransferase family 4 protein [Anaerolineae bacterium]